MALVPCIFSWITAAKERTPFRVVEMGAGSGQLSYDIQKCAWVSAATEQPKGTLSSLTAKDFTTSISSLLLGKENQQIEDHPHPQ